MAVLQSFPIAASDGAAPDVVERRHGLDSATSAAAAGYRAVSDKVGKRHLPSRSKAAVSASPGTTWLHRW